MAEWQRVVAAAEKVDTLERRVAALEARLTAQPAHQTCPYCGVGRWRKISSAPNPLMDDMGAIDVVWGCDQCGKQEKKLEI